MSPTRGVYACIAVDPAFLERRALIVVVILGTSLIHTMSCITRPHTLQWLAELPVNYFRFKGLGPTGGHDAQAVVSHTKI
jgi:hypothetical protein